MRKSDVLYEKQAEKSYPSTVLFYRVNLGNQGLKGVLARFSNNFICIKSSKLEVTCPVAHTVQILHDLF